MTTPKKALTDTFIKNLKFSPTSNPVADSNGLFILAQKKGKYGFIAISTLKQVNAAQKTESDTIRKWD